MKKQPFFLFLYLILIIGKAQTLSYTDSLQNVLKIEKEDTNKIKTLNELSWTYSDKEPEKAKEYAEKALALATTLKYKKGQSSAYNNLGNIYGDEGDYKSAIEFYEKSLELKKQLQDKPGIATLYTNIGIVYKEQSKNDKAIQYYLLALKMREEIGGKKEIADSYNNIGNLLWNTGDLDSALTYHKRALAIRTEIDDKKGIAFSCNNIGGVYNDKGIYEEALPYYLKSLRLLKQIGNKMAQPIALNNIGNIYRYQKRYNEALKMFLESLAMATENKSKSQIAECYNKIATVYDDQEKYAESIEYHKKSIKLKEEIGSKKGLGESYNNIGVVYKYMKKYDDALPYFFKALKIKQEIGDKKGLISTSNNIGSVLGKQGKYTEAYKYLSEGLQYAKEVGAKDMLRDNYYMFSETYAQQKNFAKAYEYHLLYTDVKYELFNDKNSEQIIAQQTKYETEKKEAEIKLLKQQEKITSLQLEEEKLTVQKRNYLLVASILIILSLCFGGYFYFSRQKIKAIQKQEQAVRETEENERLRIAKDIHDDLGSGLSKIKFLSEVIATKAENNPEIQSSIKSISETSVNLVDNMRDLIWALDPENTTLDSLIARIREYSSDYLNDFSMEVLLDFPENIPNYKISKEAHRNIFFMVKECLQNIVKHAKATAVNIKVVVTAEQLKVTITDNGIGLGTQIKEGNGLKNIKHRAEIINAKATFNSIQPQGLEIKIAVPIQNIKKT